MKKGNEHNQEIHNDAQQEQVVSLDNLANSVVIKAMAKVKANAGRLRFLDYTKTQLVPGSIQGDLSDHPEIFVKKINEGIVGKAWTTKEVQYSNKVQDDDKFIELKNKVIAEDNKNKLRQRYLKILKDVRSEIAVPVKAGKQVLGVLSVHSVNVDAFNDEDIKSLSGFASEVAGSFLYRRAAILEELHTIEVNMMSVFSPEQVARKIAEGINRAVEKGIPNIFLFDPNFKQHKGGKPFQFIASAGASDDEKILGKFPPRYGKRKGLGMEAIHNANDIEKRFVVVEDVKHDPRGSPSAKRRGIRTTGCLPLVFNGEVVGLLYIHFKVCI
jgi:putative methionine-R-sulfoxide reductase with GAF domain